MSSIQQQQLNRFFEILNESKLISELDEQLDITSSENYAAINLGTSDAKKVKVGLLRGFKGSWNASTNTPSLADGTGLELDVYLVSTSGSSDFGSGTITFKTDDLVFYNGTKWQKIPVGNEDASNITIDDSSLIVVKETNLQSYAEGVDQALLKDRGTEVLGGTGQVSFTIGTTVFDVAATTGQIKDDTGYYSINFLGETGISLISTVVSSIYVYIDNEGEVGQQTTEPTLIEYREKLFLTRLALVGGVLQAQEEIANPGGQYTNLLRDYLSYLSSPKKGLGLSANANLTFQVASGSVFELGINNSTQADDPNEQTFTLQNPTTFFYLNRDTTLGVGQTSLNVTSYDLNGVETTLTNNRFKIMTVYKFNSGNHVVQNGQAQYSSLDEAQTAISNRVFVINPVNNNGTRLGWIIVQKNATDLTNTSTARFVNDEGSSATSTTTTGALLASNNLSDLVDLATSRTNLDVYSTTELDNLLGDKANLSGGNDFTGNQQIKDNADNSIFHKFESFWNTSKNNSTATVSFDVNRYRWFDTLNGLEAFRIQSDTQKLVSSYDISALQNLDVTGTGIFGEDLQVGNQSKLSVFLDRVLTVGSSTAGKQGGIELVGNSTVDTVVSGLTFNNTQSLSADKRIAQITSSRDGDNSIGRLDMAIWTGQDTVVTPLSLRTYGADVTGNLDVTGTGSFGDNLIVDKTQTLATDFLTPLIIKRSGGTGVGTDMITGLAFQDFNSIQAGIYANRTQANLNYGSNLEFYTNTSSGIINPQTALVKAYTIDSNQYNTWINGGEFGGVITLATASNRGELQFGSFNTDYQIFGGDNWGYLRYNAPIHRFDIANSQILRIESTGADVTGNLDVTGTATATKVTVKGASASDGVLEIQSNNGNTAADKWSFVIDNATKDLFIKSNLTQVASISDSSGNLNMLGSVTAPDFLGNWNSLATTDFVRATGSVTQTITGAKTFSAKTIFSDQIQQGTSTSSNTRAMAFGFNTISSGLSSVSFGDQTTASGDASLALGSFNIASGLSSFAVGYFNYARAKYETALGMFGTDYTPTDTSSDRLFSVGNGSDASNRDDAFIITRKGDCTLNGDFTTNGNISLENGSGNFISSDGSDGGTAVSLDMSTVDTITFKDGLYISHTTI